MVLALLAGIVVAAASILLSFNKATTKEPDATPRKVRGMRQTTNVLLEIGSAVLAVLDALQMIGGSSRRYGSGSVRIGGLGRDLGDY